MVLKNQKQIDAFEDNSRFKFILAGRRGGKTHLIKNDIERSVRKLPFLGEIYYIGPTNMQAKELIWDPLISVFTKKKWDFEPVISKQRFEFSKGRKVYVIGAEKIRRIRGHSVHKVYLDELAYFSVPIKELWMAVRPTLTDTKGSAILATTPNGKGTDAYDFYLSTKEKEDWKYFQWVTLDNPYIDPDEVAAARRELDEKSFKQEYEAEWQSFEGLAYYNFDENTHVKRQAPLRIGSEKRTEDLILSYDFNVNPTTILISQKEGDKLSIKQEYSFKNSSTEATTQSFCEDYLQYRGGLRIKIRGDATGNSRSANTGKSDYYYVEQLLTKYGFSWEREVLKSNPPIIDRLKTVNGWLKPLEGPHRIEVDPACKDLIRDLSSQVLNGRIPSDSNNLGHKADAFGYNVYYEQLMSRKSGQKTIIL